ncbi:Immune inhibitor A peptidase M6 [Paenibacillus catalpae]|uniref:Immune inhibitor A peptidase M6 n=1 Tax=Paenibacillus catalpae TaxID=1045775 RepID=A0A1I2D015_9BACL|nr:choice-of-anchor J domain-containing protein [Paenibacillus catalpae]SFE73330.1 Immune inhibitor A peptidase M6 [Paenibacillus catalpae]
MRKRKLFSMISSFILVGGLLTPAAAMATPSKQTSFNANPSVLDVGTKLRADTLESVEAEGRLDLAGSAASTNAASSSAAAGLTEADVGVVKPWLTNNDVDGQYYLTNFTLRAVGKSGEVWVANNLKFPEGDPRNGSVQITDEQVQYLLNEFETRIYPKEIEYFAPPAERQGEDGYNGLYKDDSGRVVILIDNIKDQSYYDPNYPSYIAGYFSPTISDFADRNVMTIDSLDWLNRTGPASAKPYLYEGVFAHEFQHLLHRDTDPSEESFINEGLSDFAQYMVGYGHSTDHVNEFLSNLRNSLTLWGDQSDLQILADYGNAYLFQLYLYDHYGESLIRTLFHNPSTGISGVEAALGEAGIDKSFADLYADYMTAVVLDSGYQGDSSTYKFTSIDLSPDFATSVLADNISPAWGTDFKVIKPDSKINHLYFQGLDFLRTNWTPVEDPERGTVLWSNQGDQADNFLIKELDLTGDTAPELSFDTSYHIEEQWDFGVVQVSEDGGKNWTSLSNEDTRSDLVEGGHPKIAANLPGFTGNSEGWKTETFDLSAYAGKKVLFGFRYLTDWGFNEAGWYLSNLRLNGTVIDPMTGTSGFKSLEQTISQYVNYQVEFIGLMKNYDKQKEKERGNQVKVIRVPDLINMSESNRIELADMLHSSKYDRIIMMTTYAGPEGSVSSVPYHYDVVLKADGKKDKPTK